ncbi:RuBisCO subunit binding-protein beta subunit precursor [Artemisia annua]|uniref:RuBisCO subunit binding-protein beta subunit n=1 Tax=Artemisia annua TaxID=35608 RepID=A0A2U1Q105_ARTAN|nr:RuBisCO subunit binding-protein beta subunit precursor [Artemisia annua]
MILQIQKWAMEESAALEEGIVVGGGCTLLRLASKVDTINETLANDEEKVGSDIVKSYPLNLIAKNAGVIGSVVSIKILDFVSMLRLSNLAFLVMLFFRRTEHVRGEYEIFEVKVTIDGMTIRASRCTEYVRGEGKIWSIYLRSASFNICCLKGLTFGLDKVNTEALVKHKEKHRQSHLKRVAALQTHVQEQSIIDRNPHQVHGFVHENRTGETVEMLDGKVGRGYLSVHSRSFKGSTIYYKGEGLLKSSRRGGRHKENAETSSNFLRMEVVVGTLKPNSNKEFSSLDYVLGNTPTPLKMVALKSASSLEFAKLLNACSITKKQAANKLNEINGINGAEENDYTEDELLAALDLLEPPENFQDHQWQMYKTHLRKPIAKKLSSCGKKARLEHAHTRTTGATSFARSRYEWYKENGYHSYYNIIRLVVISSFY